MFSLVRVAVVMVSTHSKRNPNYNSCLYTFKKNATPNNRWSRTKLSFKNKFKTKKKIDHESIYPKDKRKQFW